MAETQIKGLRDYVLAVLYTAKGRMKIKGKNAKWYAYYAVRNPDTGKMEYDKMRGQINYIHNYKLRLAAGKILVESINKMLRNGELNPFKPKEPAPDLIELLRKEFELKKAKSEAGMLRWRTVQSYSYSANLLIRWMEKNNLQKLKPAEFTKQHAFDFCEYMIRGKKYSGVTFNNRKKDMHIFFNAFVDREIISVNPFKKIRPMPETPARHTLYTDEQLEKIDTHMIANCYNLWVFKEFIHFTFARPIEITKFQISDIDTRYWYVTIYGDKAKAKVQRVAVIPVAFRATIEKLQLEKHPPDYYLFGKGLLPGPTPISRNRVSDMFLKEVKIPLGLPKDCTLYGFKHTYNAKARRWGISAEARRWQNGHATQAQTMAYDRSIGVELNEEFAEKMR